MIKMLLSLSLILGTVTVNAQKSPIATDNQLKTQLDSLVHTATLVFMNQNFRVGLSVGIIKDGKQYLYNYGSTKKGVEILPTEKTLYELASISKTFSSTLLAKAVLDKKVQLNDDIRKYLKQDYPNFEFKGTPITLLNLANLTSALPNWMPDNKELFATANPDAIPYLLDSIRRRYSTEQLYNDLQYVKLDTIPGTVARHCNTAAQLLGHIMEKVYGAKFEELLKKQFILPLKMKNTVLLKDSKIPAAMAVGYDGKGRQMPYINWEDMQVAASIASSSSDMLRYMAFHLNGNNEIARLSQQPTFGNVEDGAIALNWKIKKSSKGVLIVSHTGGSLGFSSYIVFCPEKNSGIVLLSNEADPSSQNELIKLAENILLF